MHKHSIITTLSILVLLVVQLASPHQSSAATASIRIANPLSNQTYSGRITVQAVAGNVASVVYQVDTQPPVPMTYDAGQKVWLGELDTTTLAVGQHHVTVIGRDAGGTNVQDRAWNITVVKSAQPAASSPPQSSTIRIANPLSNQSYSGQIVVQAVASGVAGVAYQVDTQPVVSMRYDAGQNAWQADLNTSTLSAGQHNVTVVGTTAAGTTLQDRAWNIVIGSPTPTPSGTPTPSATPQPSAAPVAPASGTFRRGVNLAGGEFGEGALPGVRNKDYTYPSASDLDYYRSKGLTLIRLPFRWERVQRSLYGPLDPGELLALDGVVAAARARDMSILLDMHNYARYHGNLIGTPAVPNTAFQDVWRKIAEHYRNERAVWAYGLMNEPHDTDGLWPAAAQAGVNGVRSVDMSHTILVAGDGWSGAWTWPQNNAQLAITDPANNFMYEAHQYFDGNGSGAYTQSYDASGAYPMIGVDRAKPFVDWLKARNARGFMGEYGVPDTDPRWLTVLDNFLGYLDRNAIGGTYWAGGPWWGTYPLSVEPRNGQDRPQMPVLQRHLAPAAVADVSDNQVFVPINGSGASQRMYGVVQPEAQYLGRAWQAGQRVRTLELGWDAWEPREGAWNTAYIATKRDEYQQAQAAGFAMVLDVGMQYPPPWLFAYPHSRYVNQHGDAFVSPEIGGNGVNAVFNQTMRDKQARYLRDVFARLGSDFYAVRLGWGQYGELNYPPPTYHQQRNSYWAYDAIAQGRAVGLPTGMLPTPTPGWTPGTPSADHAAATAFAQWYLDSLKHYHDWQLATVRSVYGGRLLMLYPSWGVRPGQLEDAIAADLAGTTSVEHNGEVQRGFAFARFIGGITDKDVVVYTTWLDADDSGDGGTDARWWSPVHYLAALAAAHPLRLEVWGENTGRGTRAAMERSFRQMERYELQGMLWAFEADLYTANYATVADYAQLMARYR